MLNALGIFLNKLAYFILSFLSLLFYPTSYRSFVFSVQSEALDDG